MWQGGQIEYTYAKSRRFLLVIKIQKLKIVLTNLYNIWPPCHIHLFLVVFFPPDSWVSYDTLSQQQKKDFILSLLFQCSCHFYYYYCYYFLTFSFAKTSNTVVKRNKRNSDGEYPYIVTDVSRNRFDVLTLDLLLVFINGLYFMLNSFSSLFYLIFLLVIAATFYQMLFHQLLLCFSSSFLTSRVNKHPMHEPPQHSQRKLCFGYLNALFAVLHQMFALHK